MRSFSLFAAILLTLALSAPANAFNITVSVGGVDRVFQISFIDDSAVNANNSNGGGFLASQIWVGDQALAGAFRDAFVSVATIPPLADSQYNFAFGNNAGNVFSESYVVSSGVGTSGPQTNRAGRQNALGSGNNLQWATAREVPEIDGSGLVQGALILGIFAVILRRRHRHATL